MLAGTEAGTIEAMAGTEMRGGGGGGGGGGCG
jgi:hypothetical protein